MEKQAPQVTVKNIAEDDNFDLHVQYLIKDPATIALNDRHKDILHMHLGIVDEVFELEECVENITHSNIESHVENFIEELGDLLFYVRGMKAAVKSKVIDILGVEEDRFDEAYFNTVQAYVAEHGVLNGSYRSLSHLPGLNINVVLASVFRCIRRPIPALNESVKRHIVYGEVDTKEKPGKPSINHYTTILDIVASIEANIYVLAASVGISVDKIKEENFKKLAKRYPEGYTDSAASERADKVEGDEVVAFDTDR